MKIMNMPSFKKQNPFMILAVLAVLAGVFRLVDIATFSSSKTAEASSTAPEESHEEPPPLMEKKEDKGHAAVEEKPEIDVPDLPAEAAQKPPPSYGGEQSFSASEIEVLQSLSKRRVDLDKRESTISEREALLKAAEEEVDKKIVELNMLKTDMEKLLGQQQTMEKDRITSLVKIYEGMKPKEAATIFNTLDMDVLLAVIGQMNERKTSPILASMEPEIARIITIRLAEQRQLPSEGDIQESKKKEENKKPDAP